MAKKRKSISKGSSSSSISNSKASLEQKNPDPCKHIHPLVKLQNLKKLFSISKPLKECQLNNCKNLNSPNLDYNTWICLCCAETYCCSKALVKGETGNNAESGGNSPQLIRKSQRLLAKKSASEIYIDANPVDNLLNEDLLNKKLEELNSSDDYYVLEPNSHAIQHFNDSKHSIIFCNDTAHFYCFLCQKSIIYNSKQNATLLEAKAEILKWFDKPKYKSSTDHDNQNTNTFGAKARRKSNKRSEKVLYPGLTNLGNTCFFNSVTQCLVYSDPVKREVQKLREEEMGPVILSFKNFLADMESSTKTVNPKDLFAKISLKFKIYKGFQQQDSHELLRRFLDELSEEHQTLIPKKTPTFIDKVFRGKLVSVIVCLECGFISPSFEDFLDLSLPLNPVVSKSKLFSKDIFKRKKPTTLNNDGEGTGISGTQLNRSDSKSDSSVEASNYDTSNGVRSSSPFSHDSNASSPAHSPSRFSSPSPSQIIDNVNIHLPINENQTFWIQSLLKKLQKNTSDVNCVDYCLNNFFAKENLSGENSWSCEMCTKRKFEEEMNNKKDGIVEFQKHQEGTITVENASKNVIIEKLNLLSITDSSIPKHNIISPIPISPTLGIPNFLRNEIGLTNSADEFGNIVKDSTPVSNQHICDQGEFEKNANSSAQHHETFHNSQNCKSSELKLIESPNSLGSKNCSPNNTSHTFKSISSPKPAFFKSQKRYLIHKSPEILVLNLKRFQQMNGIFSLRGTKKIEDLIMFEEYLDLGDYMADFQVLQDLISFNDKLDPKNKDLEVKHDSTKLAELDLSRKNHIYRLYGVVVHSAFSFFNMKGSLFGGHYYSYIRIPRKMDSEVSLS
ncbi:hypothetical protein HDU92_001092 [Lobulomyces angularis]|nr:hypothetical protein HDU92_001092 [Lobulomyces angularis]